MTEACEVTSAGSGALLGDTAARGYADKLSRFNDYAKPELRRLNCCNTRRVACGPKPGIWPRANVMWGPGLGGAQLLGSPVAGSTHAALDHLPSDSGADDACDTRGSRVHAIWSFELTPTPNIGTPVGEWASGNLGVGR
jgi:hypothetical protein